MLYRRSRPLAVLSGACFQERNIEVLPIPERSRTEAVAELLSDIRS